MIFRCITSSSVGMESISVRIMAQASSEEIEDVNAEIEAAERKYDLNRAAELNRKVFAHFRKLFLYLLQMFLR